MNLCVINVIESNMNIYDIMMRHAFASSRHWCVLCVGVVGIICRCSRCVCVCVRPQNRFENWIWWKEGEQKKVEESNAIECIWCECALTHNGFAQRKTELNFFSGCLSTLRLVLALACHGRASRRCVTAEITWGIFPTITWAVAVAATHSSFIMWCLLRRKKKKKKSRVFL